MCGYCGASYILPQARQPQPQPSPPPRERPATIGDLLLGTDFRDPDLPGWRRYYKEQTQFIHQPGLPPELEGTFKKEKSLSGVVGTCGPLHNCDISVNIRFISGSYTGARAGIEFRYRDEGNYVAILSPQGTYCVGYHVDRKWGDYLNNWSRHPALKEGWGEINRLRVLNRGEQIRVYLNGSLAASIRDTRYTTGRALVVVGPIGEDTRLAISDLQIREVTA